MRNTKKIPDRDELRDLRGNGGGGQEGRYAPPPSNSPSFTKSQKASRELSGRPLDPLCHGQPMSSQTREFPFVLNIVFIGI